MPTIFALALIALPAAGWAQQVTPSDPPPPSAQPDAAALARAQAEQARAEIARTQAAAQAQANALARQRTVAAFGPSPRSGAADEGRPRPLGSDSFGQSSAPTNAPAPSPYYRIGTPWNP